MSQAQQDAAITSIANVSRLLRQAIGAAIPVAPDQYLTISIPGTVIDTTDSKYSLSIAPCNTLGVSHQPITL